jgi:putative spermidine/putrescine transport system substrate-binding protein
MSYNNQRPVKISRRDFLKLGATAGGTAFLAACAGGGAQPAASLPDLTSGASIPMDALAAAAKAEGSKLSVIALPRDWANWGGTIDAFKAKYGIEVTELFPDAGSGEELEAIRVNKNNKGAQNPDVVDVGISYGPTAVEEGLFAKYKVAGWDGIPDGLKDPDGYWWAEYFGVLGFQANADIVKTMPETFEDLLKPEYKNMVSIGDPTTGNEPVMSVWASGMERTGGKIEGAAEAGIEFWAEMQKAGNLVPVSITAGTLAKGETPLGVRWDYLALADRDTLKGNPDVIVTIPKTIALGGPYIGGINAFSPRPYAVRLWVEYYMSDEGQLSMLKGYAHPARYLDMVKRNVIPAELSDKLPPAEYYEKAIFPELDAIVAAKAYISENWRTKVLGQ